MLHKKWKRKSGRQKLEVKEMDVTCAALPKAVLEVVRESLRLAQRVEYALWSAVFFHQAVCRLDAESRHRHHIVAAREQAHVKELAHERESD